jgi:transcriptional regulator with XRE-family HTH domain
MQPSSDEPTEGLDAEVDLAGSRQSLRVVPPESWGSRLRRKRLADDLTQAELGERFGVAQQTIGAWERGERPQSRFFGELASYVGLEGEQELVSLIDSEPVLPTEQSSTGKEAPDDPCRTDAATMRFIARNFVEAQRTGSLQPAEADVYRNLTNYFLARGVDR